MIKLGTVMPYLKDLQQSQVTHPLSSPDRNRQILLYQEKQKLIAFGTLVLILLALFFESLHVFLINMVTILMMSPNMATLGPLKIKTF